MKGKGLVREVITYYRNPEWEKQPGQTRYSYALPREPDPARGFTLPEYRTVWWVRHDTGAMAVSEFCTFTTLAEAEAALPDPPPPDDGECPRCKGIGLYHSGDQGVYNICGACGMAFTEKWLRHVRDNPCNDCVRCRGYEAVKQWTPS